MHIFFFLVSRTRHHSCAGHCFTKRSYCNFIRNATNPPGRNKTNKGRQNKKQPSKTNNTTPTKHKPKPNTWVETEQPIPVQHTTEVRRETAHNLNTLSPRSLRTSSSSKTPTSLQGHWLKANVPQWLESQCSLMQSTQTPHCSQCTKKWNGKPHI